MTDESSKLGRDFAKSASEQENDRRDRRIRSLPDAEQARIEAIADRARELGEGEKAELARNDSIRLDVVRRLMREHELRPGGPGESSHTTPLTPERNEEIQRLGQSAVDDDLRRRRAAVDEEIRAQTNRAIDLHLDRYENARSMGLKRDQDRGRGRQIDDK